ncbi:MAG: hypothetical protein FWC92_07295 [Defluviitaleaceae bacterium]|nr:hypothetical protein [Defluviitaleaceae bacterium]
MNRLINAMLLFVIVLLGLSACQLAREGIAQEEAWMVGVFITTEHLNLTDHSLEGQVIPMRRGRPDLSALFQPGRLYALWDETTGDFRFPDIDGIPLFTAVSPPHVPNETVISHVGGAISGGHNHMFYGDNYTRVEMEGTIYIVPGSRAMAVVHMNPVYQTADGSVFLTNGNAFSGHGLRTEGPVFSSSVSHTRSVTENGSESTNSISIKLNVSGMFAPEKVVFLEMDEYSHVILRSEFEPGEIPQTFYASTGTAYIIVETHRDAAQAETRVVRELIAARNAHDNSWITTHIATEDGILEGSETEIIWPSSSQ